MTAVITKYKKTFDKWVEANPDYPNPVHISCEEDIGDKQFWFVRHTGSSTSVFNYKRVKKICLERLCLYVAIIGFEPAEARRWNKTHTSIAKSIPDVEYARKYWYSEVIIGASSKKLKRPDLVLMECQKRIVDPILTYGNKP